MSKRVIAAVLLFAALGLMIYPPWRGRYGYSGHRLLWGQRGGNPDWAHLLLELCLLGAVGVLAALLAPIAERCSLATLKIWLQRVGLVLGCAAVLLVAVKAGYAGIAYYMQVRAYEAKVREFRAKTALLREAFPMQRAQSPAIPPPPAGFDEEVPLPEQKKRGKSAKTGTDIFDQAAASPQDTLPVYEITNFHEAEFILRRLGWGGNDIQRVTGMFLSATVPESYQPKRLSFLSSDEVARSGTKGASIEFYIRDDDAAKRFFAPLPDWYAEALRQNIEVSRVPEWMKPGEPPTFPDWLDWQTLWITPALVALALGVICFVTSRRLRATMPDARTRE